MQHETSRLALFRPGCWAVAVATALTVTVGCGTTRWSDTARTATEQLLLSDAMDRAVSQLDFSMFAGCTVYLDTGPVKQVLDSAYLVSSVRQRLIASDCILKEKPDEADFVVELRAGTVGTDRHELLFGIPATTLPASTPGTGTQIIPELPLAKRTDQRAVAKIAAFAYDRHTSQAIWQSGTIPIESKARDLWVFGAGPFQRGSIHSGTRFAGHHVPTLLDLDRSHTGPKSTLAVTQEALFCEPTELANRHRARREAETAESKPQEPPKPATPSSAVAAAPPSPPPPPPPSGLTSGLGATPVGGATVAPTSGMTNGFSGPRITRLPDIKLPWSSGNHSSSE
mgnify:CR=1 FL=1